MVKVIVWPTLILLICIIFRVPLISLLTPNLNQNTVLRFGKDGIEISKIAAAVASVAVGSVVKSDKENPVDQKALAKNLAQGIEASLTRSTASVGKNLLWVDDVPRNNIGLINAFEDVGINVIKALSTSEAEQALKGKEFDLIITDMSRPPDDTAGLSLLDYLKTNNIKAPVIVFAAYWASQHLGQEDSIGVVLITNETSKVYSTVLRMLLTPKRS